MACSGLVEMKQIGLMAHFDFHDRTDASLSSFHPYVQQQT